MQGTSPVDNNTYNLLQILTSKLEAIEAYQKYIKDANPQSRAFLEDCLQADEKAAQRAIGLLRESLAGQRTPEMAGTR